MSQDFWERCSKANCVVIPIKAYSDWVDGDLHDSKCEGLKYAALRSDGYTVGPDYWFMLDESFSGADKLFSTPLEALEAFERDTSQLGEAK